ncbi:hypothetical protein HDU96_001823, partial [Phlyctochytrium bullatum]
PLSTHGARTAVFDTSAPSSPRTLTPWRVPGVPEPSHRRLATFPPPTRTRTARKRRWRKLLAGERSLRRPSR